MSLVVGAVFAFAGWMRATNQAPPQYEFEQTPPVDEARLKAYRYPVEAVDGLTDDASREQVERAASIWLSSYRLGMLQEVGPVSLDDLGDRGPKFEILCSRIKLSSAIIRWARICETNDLQSSVRLNLDLLEVNEVFKHSTPESMLISSATQLSCLNALRRLSPRMTEEDCELVTIRLAHLARPQRPLENFTLRLNAAYLKRHQQCEEKADSVSYELLRFAGQDYGSVAAKPMTLPKMTQEQDHINLIAIQMVRAMKVEQRLRSEADAFVKEVNQLPR